MYVFRDERFKLNTVILRFYGTLACIVSIWFNEDRRSFSVLNITIKTGF